MTCMIDSVKKSGILILALTILTVLTLGFLSVEATRAEEGGRARSKVLTVTGSVTVKYAGAKLWVLLKEGSEISRGDQIKTHSNSEVNLELPDGSIVKVGPESHLRVVETGSVEITKMSSNRLWLIYGKIRAVVAPLVNERSEFTVETENATIGVRGTDFGVFFDFNTGKTDFFCLEGNLEMKVKGMGTRGLKGGGGGFGPVSVGANKMMSVTTGVKPGGPSEMSGDMHDKFESLMGFTNSEVIDKVKNIRNKSKGSTFRGKVKGGRTGGGDGKESDGTETGTSK